MAKKLYSLKDLKREDWMKLRKEGIGGSEIGGLAGLNKYSSPLKVFIDKTTETFDDEDNNYMKWGRIMEDPIAKQFEIESEELTGKKFTVRNDNFVYADDEYNYMRASIDRKLNHEVDGKGILEVKTTTGLHMEEWEDEQMPESYWCQLMWYMGIKGYKYGYIVVLDLVSRELLVRRLDFDEEAFQMLRGIAKTFWETFVIPGVMPAPSGNKCDDEIINGLNEESFDEVHVDESEATAEKIRKRFSLDESIKDMTKAKKQIEQELKIMLGTAQKATTKEYFMTYKPDKNNRRSLRFRKRDEN